MEKRVKKVNNKIREQSPESLAAVLCGKWETYPPADCEAPTQR